MQTRDELHMPDPEIKAKYKRNLLMKIIYTRHLAVQDPLFLLASAEKKFHTSLTTISLPPISALATAPSAVGLRQESGPVRKFNSFQKATTKSKLTQQCNSQCNSLAFHFTP